MLVSLVVVVVSVVLFLLLFPIKNKKFFFFFLGGLIHFREQIIKKSISLTQLHCVRACVFSVNIYAVSLLQVHWFEF